MHMLKLRLLDEAELAHCLGVAHTPIAIARGLVQLGVARVQLGARSAARRATPYG